MDGDTLGRRIQAARALAGLSRQELADELGYHPNEVGRWERGDNEPRRAALTAIAQATDLPVAFFTEEHEGLMEAAAQLLRQDKPDGA